MLEASQSVRGIEIAYNHCMRTDHWPYLRLLEMELMSNSVASNHEKTAHRPRSGSGAEASMKAKDLTDLMNSRS